MSTKRQRVLDLLARPIRWPCAVVAVEAVAMEEDCRLVAYFDTTRTPTNGWGETHGVRIGDVWTQEYADERLRLSLEHWSMQIRRALRDAPTTVNQFAAMLCLAYNIGIPGFLRSTVLRCHLAGDYAGAARAFAMWNKSTKGGVTAEDDVLVGRRAREAALYMTPDEGQDHPKAVQAVDGESKISQSPIMVGGAVAVSTGGVAMAKEVLDAFVGVAEKVHGISGSLSVKPVTVLALVAIAVGVTSMYWRWKQRKGGWA